jgi:hypothetical protein
MVNAAICRLGRWGQALVTARPGKSDCIRFVRGVVRDPVRAHDFALRHGLAGRFRAVIKSLDTAAQADAPD